MEILTELHQDEPVSEVEPLHDVLDVFYVTGLCPATEYENT